MTTMLSRKSFTDLAVMAMFCMGLVTPVLAQPVAIPKLQVYGNTTTIELAPVLMALNGYYKGPAALTNGGIPNLFSASNDAASVIVATNAETQALRQSVDHTDLRIIFTVSSGLYRIVAKRSSGIKTLADLKGKKVGTFLNTSSQYFLHKMLKTVHLSIDDVTVVSITSLDQYKTALTGQGLDAITVWEPGADYAVESIGKDAIEFSGKGIYREIFSLYTTASALADPLKHATILQFVKALKAATDDLNATPKLAWPLVARSSGLPEAVVEHAWPHHEYTADLAPDLLDVMVEEDQWVARETKRMPRTREQLAQLIDASVYLTAKIGR
jgi:sulfonate transport system substrate-binding protein